MTTRKVIAHARDVLLAVGIWFLMLGLAAAVDAVDLGLKNQLVSYAGYRVEAFVVALGIGFILVALALLPRHRFSSRRRTDWF